MNMDHRIKTCKIETLDCNCGTPGLLVGWDVVANLLRVNLLPQNTKNSVYQVLFSRSGFSMLLYWWGCRWSSTPMLYDLQLI